MAHASRSAETAGNAFRNLQDSVSTAGSDIKAAVAATADNAANLAKSLGNDISATFDDVRDRASVATQQAVELALEAEDSAASTFGDLRKHTSAALDQAKAGAVGAASEAFGMAHDFADAGKNVGADVMAKLAHAVDGAASDIEGQAQSAARLAHSVASDIEGASRNLHDSSIEQLAANIASFTRKQPIGALCGAFLAGIVLARLLGPRSGS
jgi:hypothetical protein